MKKSKTESALRVMDGVSQPPSTSKEAIQQHLRKQQKQISLTDIYNGILEGSRTWLSRGITLVESTLPKHYEQAQELINMCIPHSGNSIRIGVTGVPGAGKSTFIEAFGKHITQQKNKVAVLAIDPSSTRTKGSILGDKTRMELLSSDKNAFIRPSPSAGSLGGVAQKTRESIILCEAAGYNYIFVETVGVGQSETAVHSMVDFFLLLMLGGAGDELQGIKRGIMEMADIVLLNKADGDNINRVNIAMAELKNALHYFPPTQSGWTPQCLACSSITKKGIPEIVDVIDDYIKLTKENGYFYKNRTAQIKHTMLEVIHNELFNNFYNIPEIKKLLEETEKELSDGKLSAYKAAEIILEKYRKLIK